MALRRISFLDSFLSGGWRGTSLRRSSKAPVTFCWRQRSLELVKTLRPEPQLPPGAVPEAVPGLGSEGDTPSGDPRDSACKAHIANINSLKLWCASSEQLQTHKSNIKSTFQKLIKRRPEWGTYTERGPGAGRRAD